MIPARLGQRLTAQRIWQDLTGEHGFTNCYYESCDLHGENRYYKLAEPARVANPGSYGSSIRTIKPPSGALVADTLPP